MKQDQPESKLDFKSILLSAGLHIALVLGFSINSIFFDSAPINIQSAIRVDVVDLPDKDPAPPAKVTPKAKPKPVAKVAKPKTDSVDLRKKKDKARKSKMDNAIARARALQKIQDLVEEEPTPPSAPVKGNEISKGSSLKGVKKLQYDDYIGVLENHIRASWSIPGWLANLELSASVLVKVTEQGFVKFKRIIKSSGNEAYDDAVLATVDKSSPFPAPSDKFKRILENEGFVLGFPE